MLTQTGRHGSAVSRFRHSTQPQLLPSSLCVCFLFLPSFFSLPLSLLQSHSHPLLSSFSLLSFSLASPPSSSSATPSVALSCWLSDQPATLRASSPPSAPLIYYPGLSLFPFFTFLLFLFLSSVVIFFNSAVLLYFARPLNLEIFVVSNPSIY